MIGHEHVSHNSSEGPFSLAYGPMILPSWVFSLGPCCVLSAAASRLKPSRHCGKGEACLHAHGDLHVHFAGMVSGWPASNKPPSCCCFPLFEFFHNPLTIPTSDTASVALVKCRRTLECLFSKEQE